MRCALLSLPLLLTSGIWPLFLLITCHCCCARSSHCARSDKHLLLYFQYTICRLMTHSLHVGTLVSRFAVFIIVYILHWCRFSFHLFCWFACKHLHSLSHITLLHKFSKIHIHYNVSTNSYSIYSTKYIQ